MWVKRALVVVPVVILAFLLQSVFWVPGTQQAADNQGRKNRVIWYLGSTPEDMNPWQGTSATDSDIYAHLSEPLLYYSENYEVITRMAEQAAVQHEITLLLPPETEFETFAKAVRDEFGTLVDVVEARPPAIDVMGDLAAVAADPLIEPALRYAQSCGGAFVKLAPRPVRGEITTAVAPDFLARVSVRLGSPLHEALDKEVDSGARLAAGTEGDRRRLAGLLKLTDPKELPEKMAAIFAEAGLAGVTHTPVGDFRLRDDLVWTDGPFFSAPERTFIVSVDGVEAGVFEATSGAEAEATVRRRLEISADAKVTSRAFEERFGDNTGPWWGKGPRITSRDVKLTFGLLRDDDFASPRKSSFDIVKEVRTFENDPLRFAIAYSELYSPAIPILAYTRLLPFHHWNNKAWTDEAIRKGKGPRDVSVEFKDYKPARFLKAKERDYSRRPASNGNFVLWPLNGNQVPLWENGRLIRLLRNEFTWQRKPEYQWLDFYVFPQNLGAETAEMVFNTGGIDVYNCQPHQVRRYEEFEDRYYVIKRRTTQYAYLGLNTKSGPTADPRVRRALAMALDSDEIIKYIVWGQGERISGPGYPVLPWYDHNYSFEYRWLTGEKKGQTEKLKFIPFSTEEAKALLVEAGYDYSSGVPVKDGKALEIKINTHPENPVRRDIVLYAQQYWQRLGIKVTIEEREWNVYLAQIVRPGNFQVCVLGWSGGLDFDKRQLWHSSALHPHGLNYTKFNNARADQIMDDILKVYDFKEQVALSHELFKLIANDLPYIFLYSPWTTTIVDRRVVWRKEVEENGIKRLENRPLSHENIAGAKAAFTYWMHEFLRAEETPQWTDADQKN